MNKEGGKQGSCHFGQKLLNMQLSVGRCAGKSPITRWANVLSLQKNSLQLNTASHKNTSWYTDADGFLEHSPIGGSLYYKGFALQKVILFFCRVPNYKLERSSRMDCRHRRNVISVSRVNTAHQLCILVCVCLCLKTPVPLRKGEVII